MMAAELTRFERGLITTSLKPDQNSELWQLDARSGLWVTRAENYAHLSEKMRDGLTRWFDLQLRPSNLSPLRDYQEQAEAAWLIEKRGIIVLPTGTGKTEVALSIMGKLAVSTLIVAPVRDLMYQWHRRIKTSLGYNAGIIGDQIMDVRDISCTTYASAAIHMERLGDRFKFIVFDECHHLPGPVRGDAARMSCAPWRLGLTATPERSDGKDNELTDLIGPITYRMPLSQARGKHLADYDVVRVPVFLSDEEQSEYDRCCETMESFRKSWLAKGKKYDWAKMCGASAVDPEARDALRAHRRRASIENRAKDKLRVLEDLFSLHPKSPTIVFVGSNQMAYDVALRFLIPPLLSHCGKNERAEILQRFEAGEYPAIVVNRVIDEGVDLPAAKVAVILGGQSSQRQATQRLGRILRPSQGRKAVLYEVVCSETAEVQRSRQRRKTDAYTGTRHRRA
jgi:superfamily II DNA or RNA helicase